MSGPKPTTTTCHWQVPVSELPVPVQVAVYVAVATAVGNSGNEVDKTTVPYDAKVCTAARCRDVGAIGDRLSSMPSWDALQKRDHILSTPSLPLHAAT